MKSVLKVLAGASLAVSMSIGCAQSYDLRIDETLKNMKYKRDLEKNTEDPPSASNLASEEIYIRAAKGLEGPAKTFAFVVEPGRFDIADTFIDQEKGASLHILARSNKPKAKGAATKKAPGPPVVPAAPGTEEEPPPAAARGDFTTDVLDFLRAAYSTEIEPLKPVDVNSHGRKGVNYKGTTLDLGDKQVKVYFHGEKTDPAQIALIFEGSKAAPEEHQLADRLQPQLAGARPQGDELLQRPGRVLRRRRGPVRPTGLLEMNHRDTENDPPEILRLISVSRSLCGRWILPSRPGKRTGPLPPRRPAGEVVRCVSLSRVPRRDRRDGAERGPMAVRTLNARPRFGR